VREGSG